LLIAFSFGVSGKRERADPEELSIGEGAACARCTQRAIKEWLVTTIMSRSGFNNACASAFGQLR
jgi:hypothetical protein